MRTAKVTIATRVSHRHNEEVGSGDVIKIITDLPAGTNNCFYISPVDYDKIPLRLQSDDRSIDPNLEPVALKEGDTVQFDVRKGFNCVVLWNGRKFRQKGYSYDCYAPLR